MGRLIENVLLDIDGTLIDSNPAHARAWKELLGDLGVQVPLGKVSMMIGMGGDKMLQHFFPGKYNNDEIKKLSKKRDDLYVKNYFATVRPIAGVMDFMRAMHSRGLRVALATSSREEILGPVFKLIPIRSFCVGVTPADKAEQSKPAPDIFEAAIKTFGFDRGRTVVIGDSPYDIEAAQKVPCKSIAVRTGGFPYQMLSGATEQYDSIQHLTRLMEKSLLGM